MPFIDLNNNKLPVTRDFDVTIIGAGAAGILLAVKLTKAGKTVLVIESGHFGYDAERQTLNHVLNTGKFLSNAVEGRIRAVGGTTTAWGGQSLPFSQLDFSNRSWLENSGWPLPFEDVDRYYNEANEFMKIDPLNFREAIFEKIQVNDPGFDKARINFHVSKWAPNPDFEKLYHTYLDKHVTILYNAQVIKISCNEQSMVESIMIAGFNSQRHTIAVKKLVIAAGGIETVRILLANGLGNLDFLGKGFMEHPCIRIGTATGQNMYKLQKLFNTHQWQGRKYSLRLSLAEAFQRTEQTLNCSGSLMFLPAENTFDPYAEIKSFIKDRKPQRLIRASRSLPRIMQSIYALAIHRFFYKAKAEASLVLMAEQEATTDSYIKLSNETDEFGSPKAIIHWAITEKTWHTVVKTAAVLKSEIERLGLAKISLLPNVDAGNTHWLESLSDVNHHMGGAKMSATPQEGVVDKNLQVWHIPNLYVCSAAVFPTSSHSNPTLTILALGCRLADHLSEAVKSTNTQSTT